MRWRFARKSPPLRRVGAARCSSPRACRALLFKPFPHAFPKFFLNALLSLSDSNRPTPHPCAEPPPRSCTIMLRTFATENFGSERDSIVERSWSSQLGEPAAPPPPLPRADAVAAAAVFSRAAVFALRERCRRDSAEVDAAPSVSAASSPSPSPSSSSSSSSSPASSYSSSSSSLRGRVEREARAERRRPPLSASSSSSSISTMSMSSCT